MTTEMTPTEGIVSDDRWPDISYQHLRDPDEAHRVIAEARRHGTVALGPFGPEVLGYSLVRTVLRDPRFATATGLGLDVQGISSGPLWDRATQSILSLDGEAHHRLRRLVAGAFTPRAAARLRESIVSTITGLVDPLTAVGGCDVVSDVARLYPTAIICALLGVPDEDWRLFSDWADEIMKLFDFNAAADAPAILGAWQQLDDYLEDMINRRRRDLTDDLLSDLIRAEQDGDRLSHDELLMLAAALLNAGTDTTRNQLAAAVQVLAAHPDQWALLADHPEMAEKAVHEVMRYYPVLLSTGRKAAADVELDGMRIPAGTLLFANTAAANRDPAVYDDPHRLDISRDAAPAMLTFGGGMHYCLGAHLARLELAEALRVITGRWSCPVSVSAGPWKVMAGITGPTELIVEFGAARSPR